MVQIVALTGTLTYTGENRITAVLCGNVSDQLLDQYGLSYTRTSKQSDFSTLLIWACLLYTSRCV